MKGKEVIPGKDPVFDKALADLRKGLREGEDAFYYDLNSLPTDTSDPGRLAAPIASAVKAQPAMTERQDSLVRRLLVQVRRHGIQSALGLGAVVGLAIVLGYVFGFSRGQSAVQAEAAPNQPVDTVMNSKPVPAHPPAASGGHPVALPSLATEPAAPLPSRDLVAPAPPARTRSSSSSATAGRAKK